MRFLFVVHKNEEKAEQNSVLFHRLTLKERGLRPNGYFPLMRQPLARFDWCFSGNQKSTRIIKTLMDFFFFIKVKIKMVCFSVPFLPKRVGKCKTFLSFFDFFRNMIPLFLFFSFFSHKLPVTSLCVPCSPF